MKGIQFQGLAWLACEAVLSFALVFILTQSARAQDAPVLIESVNSQASH